MERGITCAMLGLGLSVFAAHIECLEILRGESIRKLKLKDAA
jgi:hypothetical protein